MSQSSLSLGRSFTYSGALFVLAGTAAVASGLSLLMRPFSLQVLLQTLSPEQLARVNASSLMAQLTVLGILESLIVPVSAVAFSAGIAFLIIRNASLSPRKPNVAFSCVFAIVAWAQLALLAKQIVQSGLLVTQSVELVHTIADLVPGVGLGALLGDPTSLLYHVGELVNVFDFAYLLLFIWLLERHAHVSTALAVLAAIVAWAAGNSLRIGWMMSMMA